MTDPQPKISFPLVAVATGLTLALGMGAGRLLTSERNAAAAVEDVPQAAQGAAERFKIPVTDTQPSRGPVDALVTIIAYCDLRGEPCRKADQAMQAIMKAYEGRVRWVHRSLVDPSEPEKSHRMHAFARAAFLHADKFWEMREQFLKTPDGLDLSEQDYARITHQLGLDYEQIKKTIADQQHDGAIAVDSVFAIKFGVTGRSGFFVNGRRVDSTNPEKLERNLKILIEEELASAQTLVDQGVAKDKLYAQLIEEGRWGVSAQDEQARQAKLAEKMLK